MSTTKTTITAGSELLDLAPEKPRRFLEKALRRDLTVTQHTPTGSGVISWTILSSNPIDDWQLWIYFQAGARGGRLSLRRYTSHKRATTKLTQRQAGMTIDDMGDALDRHKAREAAKATRGRPADVLIVDDPTFGPQGPTVQQAHAALAQVGQELNGAVIELPDAGLVHTSPAPVRDLSQATQLLADLKANARFALRAARNGAIPAATPGKVRTALIRRGLAYGAGGALTELGRTVRSLVLG